METMLPFYTADLSGIAGVIKERCEDFTVEEIPAYDPCGRGEHLYLWIEKRDLSAEQLQQQLTRCLKISRKDLGMAGLKDRSAVTWQYVSVPARCEDQIVQLGDDRFTILHAKRHTNKLKTGHLRGNRFSILLREVPAEGLQHCERIAQRMRQDGFPNYFGNQRFGHAGGNVNLGLQLLRGEITARSLPAKRRRFLLRMALSSVQSHLFNLYLANRIHSGNIHKVLSGDIMQVSESGGKFRVEDVARETERYVNGQIGITGPMFGPKMLRAAGEPAEWEHAVLSSQGLTSEQFGLFPKLTAGTRRLLMIKPESLQLERQPEGIRFQFTLPAGCYATSLLREFMKTDV